MPRRPANAGIYKMDEDEKQLLESWLQRHLDRLDSVLQNQREKWKKYIKLYKAIREQEDKTFPWPGCSNIFMPEVFNEVSTLASHFLVSTIRQDPSVRVKSYFKDDASQKEAEAWEQLLDFYTREIQGSEEYWRRNLPYLILLGSHVCKLSMYTKDGKFGWPEVRLSPISLHRFFAYPSIRDLDKAPVVADMAWVPMSRLLEWVEGGWAKKEDVEVIGGWVSSDASPVDPWTDYRLPDMSIPGSYVDIYDSYVQWDKDDPMVKPIPLRVVYHRKTTKVLWAETWEGRISPYRMTYFRADEDNLFGIGLGDLMWTLQEGLNTTWNQNIDNSTVANTKVFTAPTGSGVQPDEPIWPGRTIVGPQADKMKALPIGDIHTSGWMIPQSLRSYMQYTSGATDTFSGMPDTVAKTRTTFAGQALNMRQGVNRQDLIQSEFERGLTDILWATVDMLVTYASGFELKVPVQVDARKRLQALLEESPAADVGALLRARLDEDEATLIEGMTFTMPDKTLRRERFRISVSGKTESPEAERQSAILMSQLVNQYLKQVVEMAMLFQQSQSAPVIQSTIVEAWRAANQVMKKVLWSFSMEEVQKILVDLEEVMNNAVQQYQAGAYAPEPPPELGGGEGQGGEGEMGVGFGDLGGPAGLEGAPSGFLGGRPSD